MIATTKLTMSVNSFVYDIKDGTAWQSLYTVDSIGFPASIDDRLHESMSRIGINIDNAHFVVLTALCALSMARSDGFFSCDSETRLLGAVDLFPSSGLYSLPLGIVDRPLPFLCSRKEISSSITSFEASNFPRNNNALDNCGAVAKGAIRLDAT